MHFNVSNWGANINFNINDNINVNANEINDINTYFIIILNIKYVSDVANDNKAVVQIYMQIKKIMLMITLFCLSTKIIVLLT